MGRLVVLSVLDANVRLGDARFSTGEHRGPGTPIIVGQAFAEDGKLMIDFTDPNIETILVRVRLEEGDDHRFSGSVAAGDLSAEITCDLG